MSPSVSTIKDFVNLLRKSGLAEASKIDEVIASLGNLDSPLTDEVTNAFLNAKLITTWHLKQLLKGKHKGFFLERYKLLNELGKGGMSSVYLAEHTSMHLPVAIKVLPVKRVSEKSYLERFQREAKASFRLRHDNIAGATNFDHHGDLWYIVLDYIEGEDLHQKVKRTGPLPVRDAVEYIRQAACGLEYAHKEGLVHRDVKPANLMLDTKGTVKLLDLGLALDGDDDEEGGLTKAHDEKVLGTADYLAPEQSKNSHSADPRSDIYALGCTLYYLIVGRAPFARGSVIERIKAHWNEPAPNPLDELEKPPADLDSALIDLYFRMMEKHPDARPQTAGEVAEQLDAWLNQHQQDRPQPAGLRRQTTESPEGSSGSLPASHTSSIAGLRRQPSKQKPSSTVGSSGNLRRSPTKQNPESSEDFEHPDDEDDFLDNASVDEEDDDEDDDFLFDGAGRNSPATSSVGASGNDDDDDFLAMTGGVNSGSGASARQGLADDISVDEWWGTTFLRLSLRAWFWIGIGLFITFVLTVITIEVLKAYKVGPFKENTAASSDSAE
ncbi:MAG: serine/threonine-protein kinase [Pirellulales bacterium]|jgi:serine/threonine protein kinase